MSQDVIKLQEFPFPFVLYVHLSIKCQWDEKETTVWQFFKTKASTMTTENLAYVNMQHCKYGCTVYIRLCS